MNNIKKSAIFRLVAIVALGIALISYCMPLVTLNFFGTWHLNIFEVMGDMEEYGNFSMGVMFSLATCIIGLVFAILSFRKVKMGCIVAIGCSGAGLLALLVTMVADQGEVIGLSIAAIECAGVGFYIHEIMMVIVLVTAAIGLYLDKTAPVGEASFVDPDPYQPPVTPVPPVHPAPPVSPTPIPRPVAGTRCIHCGTAIDANARFCQICGKSQTPAPVPGPVSKAGKVQCPYCGARHPAGTAQCKYCGTPINR